MTIYGKRVVAEISQTGLLMLTRWHYQSFTPESNEGVTDENGLAACSRGISQASIGYSVVIDVEIEGYSVSTSFTPTE